MAGGRADVQTVAQRHVDPLEGVGVAEVEGGRAVHEHAGLPALRDGDVAPPVHRHVGRGGVGEDGVDEEPVRPVGQMHVEAPGEAQHPLVRPHPQHVGAVRSGHGAGEDGVAGQAPVSGDAEVPLHSPGEPGVADREVRGADPVALVQALPPRAAVLEAPQPPAEVEQEGGAQVLVLEHRGAVAHRGEGAAVGLLGAIGQRGRPTLGVLGADAEQRRLLGGGDPAAAGVEDQLAVACAERRLRQDERGETDGGHGAPSTAVSTAGSRYIWDCLKIRGA